MDERRNECYPALPSVGWVPRRRDVKDQPKVVKARRAAVDARNAGTAETGADRAATAAKNTGGSIGGQRKGKGS